MAISYETREDFMQSIYDMFSNDGNNDRANQIIDIFDTATENCIELPCNLGDTLHLPCKVGDTIYFATKDKFNSATIDEITITENGLQFYWIQYDKSYECDEIWDDGIFHDSEIGKTVFLTLEEANRALEGDKTK